MYFEVKLGRIAAKINLNYRITVIDDDSGIGKTKLYDTIRKFPGNRAKIKSDIPLAACDNIHQIQSQTFSIIIIDEDSECLQPNYIKETVKLISNSNSWFIILTRENKLAELAYPVDAIFTLNNKNGYLKLNSKYPDFYKKNSGYPIEKIFIEDSTTGFEFFSKINKNCKSFYGKDNFMQCFENIKEGNLIIFDRIGFGACIKDFYNLYLKNSEIQVLDYDSFEGFLLSTMGINYSKYTNSETTLTNSLCTYLCQYGKTKNCDCLISCKHCSSCNYHDFFLNSEKVFNTSEYKKYIDWSKR